MNVSDIIDNYLIIEQTIRQTGKTTALVEAAKKINAVFVTADDFLSRHYKHEFNIDAIPYSSKELIGIRRPIIFDHYTLYVLFSEIRKEFRKIYNEKVRIIYREEPKKENFLKRLFKKIFHGK